MIMDTHELLGHEIVKEYGFSVGADVVGIAASADFGMAPDGFKPTDVFPECLSVIVLGAASSLDALNDIDEYPASRNAMLTAMTNMAKEVEKRILTNPQYGNLLWFSALISSRN